MPTPLPSPFNSTLMLDAPSQPATLAPSVICNPDVCFKLVEGEQTADPNCCAPRDDASCATGFDYFEGDSCETPDSAAADQISTCCLALNDGGSDSDGLTEAEELAIILTFTLTSALLFVCCLRGLYYFIIGGCRFPEFGAIGSTTYYDERRGQCFGLIAFFMLFNFVTLILSWLAASNDPDSIEAFAFARIQTTQEKTFLVIGLNGYAVFSSETGQGEYNTFDSDYGKDNDVGNRDDFDWTGECKTGGETAQSILVVIAIVQLICAFFIYVRQNPNTDSAVVKLSAAFLEFWCGLLIFSVLLSFGLRCISELPTQKIFLPDTDAQYYYGVDDTGEEYNISVVAPYTSYLCLLLSGIFSFYIGWVHWRMPTCELTLDMLASL